MAKAPIWANRRLSPLMLVSARAKGALPACFVNAFHLLLDRAAIFLIIRSGVDIRE